MVAEKAENDNMRLAEQELFKITNEMRDEMNKIAYQVVRQPQLTI